MKKIFLIMFVSVKLFSCSGDCVACHPKLIENGDFDNNHMILDTCKKCHTDGTKIIVIENNNSNEVSFTIKKLDENETKESHSACGQDCWKCHDIKNVQKVNVL